MSERYKHTDSGIDVFRAEDFITAPGMACHLSPGEAASVANRILAERSQVVYAYGYGNPTHCTWHTEQRAAQGPQYSGDTPRLTTHTALLVGIRPLVRDTAESLLRELIRWRDTPHANVDGPNTIAMRAEKLLEGK